jgi:hypothetical protein
MMLASAPGFAPAWEEVLKQAEREVRESETGIGAFVRKVFVPQLPSPRSTQGMDATVTKREDDRA